MIKWMNMIRYLSNINITKKLVQVKYCILKLTFDEKENYNKLITKIDNINP